jgi:hypothetical protein
MRVIREEEGRSGKLAPGIRRRIVNFLNRFVTLVAIRFAGSYDDASVREHRCGGVPPRKGHIWQRRPRLGARIKDIRSRKARVGSDMPSHNQISCTLSSIVGTVFIVI